MSRDWRKQASKEIELYRHVWLNSEHSVDVWEAVTDALAVMKWRILHPEQYNQRTGLPKKGKP